MFRREYNVVRPMSGQACVQTSREAIPPTGAAASDALWKRQQGRRHVIAPRPRGDSWIARAHAPRGRQEGKATCVGDPARCDMRADRLSTLTALVLAAVVLVFLSQLRVRTNAAAPHGVPPDLRAACATDNHWLVTACYASPSEPPSEGRQSAALVAFRDTADDKPQYRLALQQEVGAVWGLAYS